MTAEWCSTAFLCGPSCIVLRSSATRNPAEPFPQIWLIIVILLPQQTLLGFLPNMKKGPRGFRFRLHLKGAECELMIVDISGLLQQFGLLLQALVAVSPGENETKSFSPGFCCSSWAAPLSSVSPWLSWKPAEGVRTPERPAVFVPAPEKRLV